MRCSAVARQLTILRVIFICFQTDKFTYEQMQEYLTSVVEREVVEGIINTDFVTKYTALAFLRRIDDINMSDTRGGLYYSLASPIPKTDTLYTFIFR